MKKYSILKKSSILIAVLFFLPLSFASLSTQSAYDLFQKALAKERGEGNLEEAISLYQKVVNETKDESLAAKAQLQIGICYEKLGKEKAKQAQEAFQKVISDYPGQRDIVKMAQEKLSNLVQAQSFVEQGDRGKNLRLVWKESDVDVLEEMGVPSPDGRYISYTDWDTGNLAVYEISTQKKWSLTGKKNWEDKSWPENSRWSPDGKKIAYGWWNNDGKNDLRIIGLDGSKPRILTDSYPWIILSDWSPDGKHILAVIHTESDCRVSLVSVADGSIKTIKKREWSDGKMIFSPDGKYIAFNFQSKEGPDSDIYLLSIDGKTEVPLVEHPANDYLLGWTPNGKYLLFASDRTGTFDAWILPVSDGRPNGEPEIVRKNLGYVHPMGVTQNGDFYYASSSGIQSIFVAAVNPETCLSSAPVRKMSLPYEGRNDSAEFSPDGKQIAFVRSSLPRASINYLQAPNFLCVRSLEEGRERVFPLNRHVYDLRWAPDCSSILVSGMDQEKRVGFTRLDANTGEVTTIAQTQSKGPAMAREGFFLSPEWSDDGKALFYLHYDLVNSVCPIIYQNLETGQSKKIYQLDLEKNPMLTISPDKKWLAVIEQPIKSPTEKYERVIKIIPAEGGEPRELCRFENSKNARVMPRWSADGRFIIYPRIQSGENLWELWRVPFNGGQPQKMGISMGGPSNISPHPDGRQIAFTSHGLTDKGPEIWVMENFLPPKEKK
jgi:Tol biopolymer transport system component